MKKIINNLLTENEQKILFFVIVFAFLGVLARYTGLVANEELTEQDSIVFEKDFEIKYDLNLVNKEELISLPGIGSKRADDILTYRSGIGFTNKAELMKIKGIGTKTYAKLEKYFIDLGEADVPSEFYTKETKVVESFANEVNLESTYNITKEVININTASSDELVKLSGIGPTKADRIIELRNELGSFSDLNELLKVKGIGPKTLEKFRDQITTGD